MFSSGRISFKISSQLKKKFGLLSISKDGREIVEMMSQSRKFEMKNYLGKLYSIVQKLSKVDKSQW